MTDTVAESTTTPSRVQRVAAYAVCVREGQILLARWVPPNGRPPQWSMPGGGIDYGEDPYDAVIREVAEETGYTFRPTHLLGMDNLHRISPDGSSFHGLRIIYTGDITGGTLRDEVGGSTDRAAWFDLTELPDLYRVDLVDIALTLYRTRPTTGSLPNP